MNPFMTIKLKALFLLVSFSLNSVVGFACSLGIDMGYNCGGAHHHHEYEETHSRHKERYNECDNHSGRNSAHKGKDEKKESQLLSFTSLQQDDCCKDFVVGFQSLDKQLVQKADPAKHRIEYATFVLHTTIMFNEQVYAKPFRTPPKIPYHSPPDIRVFIQSFRI